MTAWPRRKEEDMSTDEVNRSLTTVKQMEGFGLFPPLVNLLAEGQPVAIDRLAAAASWSVGDVEAVLHRHPSVEWDEEGRLVGFGMTLRPTPHRFTFDGRTVFGWCASDALMFSVLLDRPGIVESTCPASGRPIRVDVTPRAVLRVEPAGAVVSEVRPSERVRDVRAEICAVGHFFSSREVAAGWLAQYPQGLLNSVAEDFEIHRQMALELGWAPR